MSDSEESSAGSDSTTQTTTTNTVGGQERPNKVKLKACDLEVEAQSTEMEADELVEVLSPEMESIMKHHLAGEYEVIEQRDLFAALFGEQ
ncbi:hypothetical protein [Halorubrum depositum]|uniref:hypothetical protein n=1 Tax=Halorubrum depositum TaxID=2583992 RepID=UPI0011A29634|nr:hypothetical protein [Halorubrum depositum]